MITRTVSRRPGDRSRADRIRTIQWSSVTAGAGYGRSVAVIRGRRRARVDVCRAHPGIVRPRNVRRATDRRSLGIIHRDRLRTRRVITRSVSSSPGDGSRSFWIRSIQRLSVAATSSNRRSAAIVSCCSCSRIYVRRALTGIGRCSDVRRTSDHRFLGIVNRHCLGT